MDLVILPGRLSVCRLGPSAPWPAPPPGAAVYSATRTTDELSVVCPEGHEPAGSRIEAGWRALSVVGPLAFDLVGVLATLSTALAEAGISVFVVSTFDTDLVLVKDVDVEAATGALEAAGHHLLPV